MFLTRPLKMLPTIFRSVSRSMEYSSSMAIFEQGDAAFEFFAVDDEFVAGLARSQSDQSFDMFGHGNELGIKFA